MLLASCLHCNVSDLHCSSTRRCQRCLVLVMDVNVVSTGTCTLQTHSPFQSGSLITPSFFHLSGSLSRVSNRPTLFSRRLQQHTVVWHAHGKQTQIQTGVRLSVCRQHGQLSVCRQHEQLSVCRQA
jgi:hypothetical protein